MCGSNADFFNFVITDIHNYVITTRNLDVFSSGMTVTWDILIVKEELPSKPLLNKCHVDKNKTLIENKTLTLVKRLKVHVITHHLVM